MAGSREIKDRIAGVQDTRKITNAMYLIASTKMRKAKEELDKTRPYFDALSSQMERIFRSAEDLSSPYCRIPDENSASGRRGCLVITADKGLAGSYNHNVLRAAEALLQRHPDSRLFVVGEFGRQYFRRKNITIEPRFNYSAQSPSPARARAIAAELLEAYDKGEVTSIYIVYTDLRNALSSEAHVTRLLPIMKDDHRHPDPKAEPEPHFEFLPSADAVLEAVLPGCLSGYIYSALVDSFCCEQSERMRAMDSANQNAEKLLDELSLQYNRVRQGAITQEITEISAGARAQKKRN